MNLNNMNLMQNNKIEEKRNKEWFGVINFRLKENNKTISIQVKSSDKIKTAINHFYIKCCIQDKNLYFFIYKGKKITNNFSIMVYLIKMK